MILLWGIATDEPLARVKRVLQDRGAPVFFLDEQRVLDTRIELTVNGHVNGVIGVNGTDMALQSMTSSYLRPYDIRRMRAVESAGPGSKAEAHALEIERAVIAWAEITSAMVLNRPSAMASNNSKPYQASLIRQSGLRVPDTLITTDPDAVREFQRMHGPLIYKSISGVRSIVGRLEHHRELTAVANCPTQFQRYIHGTEYRAHVIGTQVLACQVISDDIDYRYPTTGEPQISACSLPDEVTQRCIALSKALNLPLAGIDLRRTPDGEWYCFEANPSPGFTYYEDAAGLPIAEAIADLLIAFNGGAPQPARVFSPA